MYRVGLAGLTLALSVFAGSAPEARKLYQRTDYAGALRVLAPISGKDAQDWALMGKCYFMAAEYKRATEAFESATALEPANSELVLWLGRTWGRRAESASPFTAPGYAAKARQFFERSVLLDPSNKEALNDLFVYYLEAPGILGGGLDHAQALIPRIAALDPAEGHYAQAQIADKRKDSRQAEQQLRRALELAPQQLGRVLDLARYLSKTGRIEESETQFARAEQLAPNSPRILYERARTYIRDKRNLTEARTLLKSYLHSPLGPEDPPRRAAEELLLKVGA